MKGVFNNTCAYLCNIFLTFFIKEYFVGTHLNCLSLSTINIYFYKEVDKSTLAVIERSLNCLTVHL